MRRAAPRRDEPSRMESHRPTSPSLGDWPSPMASHGPTSPSLLCGRVPYLDTLTSPSLQDVAAGSVTSSGTDSAPGSPVPELPDVDAENEDDWLPAEEAGDWLPPTARQDAVLHTEPEVQASGDATTTLANGVTVQLHRACTSRASRAARPSLPTETAARAAAAAARQLEDTLRSTGRGLLRHRETGRSSTVSVGSKGPGVRADRPENQAKMNHLASIKARGVDNDQELSYLLAGFSCDNCYDRQAERVLRANAVNASILQRRGTQGVRDAPPVARPTREPTPVD